MQRLGVGLRGDSGPKAPKAEQGAEMLQPIDAVIHHYLLKTFEVKDIGKQIRPHSRVKLLNERGRT